MCCSCAPFLCVQYTYCGECGTPRRTDLHGEECRGPCYAMALRGDPSRTKKQYRMWRGLTAGKHYVHTKEQKRLSFKLWLMCMTMQLGEGIWRDET